MSEPIFIKPECFSPEADNPYPLCVGKGLPECENCQLWEKWEPEDPYGLEQKETRP